MDQPSGRRALAFRLMLALIGLGLVAWAVIVPADSYAPAASILLFFVGGLPFAVYVVVLRKMLWSLGTGLAMLGVALWTDVDYALVPASSRDGVESISIWLGCALKFVVMVVGVALDRATPAEAERSRQA